jgi:hypothetical protein
MACPGSIALSATIPDHDTTTVYAAEGTAAHELAEMSLREGVDPLMYVGKRIDGIGVTKEMALAVGMYVDKVNALAKSCNTEPQLEVRFSLARLKDPAPPVPMFGTADCVVYDEERNHIHVMDYKHGRGIVVEAEENSQLMLYALGAILQLGVKPDHITVWIVQPRAPHRDGVVRDYTFGWDRMKEFRHELLDAAWATQEPDAPLAVGDWCRFCPAQAICTAQKDYAVVVAQDLFEVDTPSLPAPDALTEEDMNTVLEHAPMIESWFRACRAFVQEKLERGEEHPEWKLVAKRATRKWKDEAEAREVLRELGIEEHDLITTSTISPAQAEKLLRRDGVEVPPHLVEKKSSGNTLAPDSDPRDAVDAVELFTVED